MTRDYIQLGNDLHISIEPSQEDRNIEMLAAFLCDTHIIPLGAHGERWSGGHGWHRTTEIERRQYRERAKQALILMDRTKIAGGPNVS